MRKIYRSVRYSFEKSWKFRFNNSWISLSDALDASQHSRVYRERAREREREGEKEKKRKKKKIWG